MKDKQAGEPEEAFASPEEIAAAYAGLTSKEKKILYYECHNFGQPLRWFDAEAFSADALVQEALIKTLAGDRPWRKNGVPLFRHLIGAARSICSNEAKKLVRNKREAIEAAMQRSGKPIEDVGSDEHLVDQEEAKEKAAILDECIATLRKSIEDDPVALDVLDGQLDDMKPAEIQSALGIDRREYERAALYIKRSIGKMRRH